MSEIKYKIYKFYLILFEIWNGATCLVQNRLLHPFSRKHRTCKKYNSPKFWCRVFLLSCIPGPRAFLSRPISGRVLSYQVLVTGLSMTGWLGHSKLSVGWPAKVNEKFINSQIKISFEFSCDLYGCGQCEHTWEPQVLLFSKLHWKDNSSNFLWANSGNLKLS